MSDDKSFDVKIGPGGDSPWGCFAWVVLILGIVVIAYLWHIHGVCG